jgi:hypothetical protein
MPGSIPRPARTSQLALRPFRNVLLACDLTLGRLGRPSTRVSGVGRAGWAGQAAFAVVGGFFLGLLAGFLIAG